MKSVSVVELDAQGALITIRTHVKKQCTLLYIQYVVEAHLGILFYKWPLPVFMQIVPMHDKSL